METLNLFSGFFDAIRKDPCVSTTHISIYMALVFYAKDQPAATPIHVFGQQIIDICKISSRSTYYRCMHDLHAFGYLQYTPVFKRNKPSQVLLLAK
ncbi:hypothetical protein Dfri01_68350 [Dyadobacter frigoris]|uniref:hypothetical protein n=1 Tax=Dyadobacter frigoris TaxID=2576211 RepID=UPI0024A16171|nr:hypothetical protein [Dyadobacter frigoris]GLU57374.1 hypothetical protein Dfri01_68350 [Dyadobacter frigoris]